MTLWWLEDLLQKGKDKLMIKNFVILSVNI